MIFLQSQYISQVEEQTYWDMNKAKQLTLLMLN